jgi:hypothetical protein
LSEDRKGLLFLSYSLIPFRFNTSANEYDQEKLRGFFGKKKKVDLHRATKGLALKYVVTFCFPNRGSPKPMSKET